MRVRNKIRKKEGRKAGRKGRREMYLVKWITITVYMNDLVASLSFVFYFASLMRSLPDFFCFFYWRWVGRGEWWGMPPPAVEGHLPGQPSCLLPSQAEVIWLMGEHISPWISTVVENSLGISSLSFPLQHYWYKTENPSLSTGHMQGSWAA